jgi:hypothetical protein
VKTVIRGVRLFYGFQHLGNLLSFITIIFLRRFSKNKSYSIKKKLVLLTFGLFPAIGLYIYSHYSYWDIVRPIVLVTREREKKYKHLSPQETEDFQIIYKASKDMHTEIQKNIGFFNCIGELFIIY